MAVLYKKKAATPTTSIAAKPLSCRLAKLASSGVVGVELEAVVAPVETGALEAVAITGTEAPGCEGAWEPAGTAVTEVT